MTQRPSFGVMTAPTNVSYDDIARIWKEADAAPGIDHAWLFDHLMPIGGDPNGPAFEAWTLLSALAAQTRRLHLGILVTSNRIRPPALLAKMAATVDVVSAGRLVLGIGAGSRTDIPWARREYDAHGLPYSDAPTAVAALDEACTVIRRLWTEEAPFDFQGQHVKLTGAFGNPKPVSRPTPPILIGGRASATLRVVARQADIWNYPGSDLADALERSRMLDGYLAEVGRSRADVVRSIILPLEPGNAAVTREAAQRALEAGFSHFVLGLPAPYEPGLARWIAEEIVAPA
jgi:alkanesulfonate monooxygenase SsuD/methylene tetrahydromethanopterin reductase-like flavin-dependent oxidoreductase (luciferase family)